MTKNSAIFLDRDGVINKEKKDYVKSIDELEIFTGIENSIKMLQENDFKIVVVTNQSAINRGLTTHSKVNEIHNFIQNHLLENKTKIDAFYYCPHRPDENCDCRKPKNGLLLKAIQDLQIDPFSSWMIGDSESDMLAGQSIGCKTIKIYENFNLQNATEKILHF